MQSRGGGRKGDRKGGKRGSTGRGMGTGTASACTSAGASGAFLHFQMGATLVPRNWQRSPRKGQQKSERAHTGRKMYYEPANRNKNVSKCLG